MIETLFWLVVTLVLTGLLTVALNYYALDINGWLDRYRSHRRLRSLTAERKHYIFILGLREDPVAVTAYFQGRHILLTMGGFAIVFAGVTALFLVDVYGSIDAAGVYILIVALYVSGMVGMSLATFSWTQRVSQDLFLFETYRERLLKRWPNEQWPLDVERLINGEPLPSR